MSYVMFDSFLLRVNITLTEGLKPQYFYVKVGILVLRFDISLFKGRYLLLLG